MLFVSAPVMVETRRCVPVGPSRNSALSPWVHVSLIISNRAAVSNTKIHSNNCIFIQLDKLDNTSYLEIRVTVY